MGTQQLLLIVLGIILLGIMVVGAVYIFQDQSASSNRDELSNDLVHMAAQAQKYYRKPAILGGGSNSFSGLTLAGLTKHASNANGTYVLSPDPVPAGTSSIVVTGTGVQIGNDGATPVEISMTVWADSLLMVANN
jgi:type II secretory pathway pseudopilin PulG